MTEEVNNDSLVTDEPVVEQKAEDVLYSEDQQSDEPVDNDQEKTEDSEADEVVAESKEEEGQEETSETTEDKEQEQDYKLELEEGSLLSEAMLGEIEGIAKENSLSKEAASNLLKTQDKMLKSWVENQMQAHEAEKDGWREQVINDQALGGDNLKKTVANARKTVDRFASEEFVNLLRSSGYGDHPEVVRMFSRIGALLSEDTLVQGGEFGGSRSAEELFYGNN